MEEDVHESSEYEDPSPHHSVQVISSHHNTSAAAALTATAIHHQSPFLTDSPSALDHAHHHHHQHQQHHHHQHHHPGAPTALGGQAGRQASIGAAAAAVFAREQQQASIVDSPSAKRGKYVASSSTWGAASAGQQQQQLLVSAAAAATMGVQQQQPPPGGPSIPASSRPSSASSMLLPPQHHLHQPPSLNPASSFAQLPLSPSSMPSSPSAGSYSQSSSPGSSAQPSGSQQQQQQGQPLAIIPSQVLISGSPSSPSRHHDSPSHSRIPSSTLPPHRRLLPPVSSSMQDPSAAGAAPDTSTGLQQHPIRKGKFVSPVWKPLEMLVLARAWRIQYCGAPSKQDSASGEQAPSGSGDQAASAVVHKAKTRAEKDWEVAEYLKQHGVQRDVKTAATKWDNMLGDFRRVHEWEKGPERDEVGKSYFRLSPHERKLYRLPASFDEDVYEEMVQYIGQRPRSQPAPRGSRASGAGGGASSGGIEPDTAGRGVFRETALIRAHSPKADIAREISGALVQYAPAGSGEAILMSGVAAGRGNVGGGSGSTGLMRPSNIAGATLQQAPTMAATAAGGGGAPSNVVPAAGIRSGGGGGGGTGRMQRVGRIKMVWEESVHLWADEEDILNINSAGASAALLPAGRLKLDSLNFLHADQLVFLDDNLSANAIEAYETGALQDFSTDTFAPGQQLKVFGRRLTAAGQSSQPLPYPPYAAASPAEPRSLWDRSSYYLSCLKICAAPSALPSLAELPLRLKQPPPRELRFPVRSDVFRDFPAGREAFFVASCGEVDCRQIVYELVAPLIRSCMSTGNEDLSLLGLWDDCINRVVKVFCAEELELIRNNVIRVNADGGRFGGGASASCEEELEAERPDVCGLIRQLCLWRGEEQAPAAIATEAAHERLASKVLWTYGDLPYILGYYAVGMKVTFCALSPSSDHHHHHAHHEEEKLVCTELATISLSNPAERLSALTPCWHVAQILTLLADEAAKQRGVIHSDYAKIQGRNGKVVEVMATQVRKTYPSRRRWQAAKEVYGVLAAHMVPYVEGVCEADERGLALVCRPRGHPVRPRTLEELLKALKCVCTALVAIHRLAYMHRDVRWENVMKRRDMDEWFLIDFDDAARDPQQQHHHHSLLNHASTQQQPQPPPPPPSSSVVVQQQQAASSSTVGVVQPSVQLPLPLPLPLALPYPPPHLMTPASHAPELRRGGPHGLKVDVFGLGYLIKSCGLPLDLLPDHLKDLQRRFMLDDPDQRPAIEECFFLIVQLHSSLQHFSA